MFNFLKYKKHFNSDFLSSESSIFSNIKNFFGVPFSWNIRRFSGISISWSIISFPWLYFCYFSSLGWKVTGSVFGNIRKALFWESIRIFLIIGLEISISGNIRNFLGLPFRGFRLLKFFNIRGKKFHFPKK